MTLHRALVLGIIGLVVLGGFVMILQIWGLLDNPDFFFRIMGTIVVLALVAGFLLAVRQDFAEHKRLKDENFLD
jgi:hypothetical protein